MPSSFVPSVATSLPSTVPDITMFALMVWFPEKVFAPVPAKFPVAVTPPCQAEPL